MKILEATYIGKYRELKPRGYRFLYMYAANYRAYMKEFHDKSIFIFVKGNDINLCGFYSKTGLIVKYIIDNRDLEKLYALQLHKETNEIIPKTVENSCYWHVKNGGNPDEYKWVDVFINKNMCTEIRKLYDDGKIKLEETTFPDK